LLDRGLLRVAVGHVPLLQALPVAVIGHPQQQEDVVERDRHHDRKFQGADSG
jgi:hypothetical protein